MEGRRSKFRDWFHLFVITLLSQILLRPSTKKMCNDQSVGRKIHSMISQKAGKFVLVIKEKNKWKHLVSR